MKATKWIFLSIALFTHNTNASEADLASHWRLDTVANGAVDYAGNNHGTFYGAPATTEGKVGSAVLFDGTNDTVLVGDDSTLDFGSGDFTISFWFKKLANTQSWDNCPGIQKWNTGGSRGTNEWSFGLCTTINNNAVAFNMESGSQIYTVSDTSANELNRWYYAVAVREGSELKLYVDAELKDSLTIGNKAINNVGRHLTMATRRSPSGTFSGYTNVIFDDVKIYHRAKSGSELLADLETDDDDNSGTDTGNSDGNEGEEQTIRKNGLLSHWKMDTTANGIIDSIGNNHGTLFGNAQLTEGKVAEAIKFDGVDDTVVIPDNDSLDFGDRDFTVSFWYKKLSSTGANWVNCPGIQKWSSGSYRGSNEWSFGLCSTISDDKIAFNIESGSHIYSINSSITETINTWYYVVGVREGNYLKLYVNGELEDSLNVGNVAINNAGRDLTFATRQSPTGVLTGYSNVIFDDIKLFATALSPQKVFAEYHLKGRDFSDIASISRVSGFVIKGDDELIGWGSNNFGQLGTGSQNPEPTPAKVIEHPISKVSLGGRHALALDNEQKLYAWGSNKDGQLGLADLNETLSPTLVMLDEVESISAGNKHSLAIKTDGSLWSWGNNAYGQLGTLSELNANEPTAVEELTNVMQASAGGYHSLAVKYDGSVWSWGSNVYGELGNGSYDKQTLPAKILGLDNVIQVVAGHTHSLALTEDGRVWSWGNNFAGQIGNGLLGEGVATPIQIDELENVVAVAAGYGHSVALKTDGTVWTWGNNHYGQLGAENLFYSLLPLEVEGLTDVVAVFAGYNNTLVLTKDGHVVTFGDNHVGQLGDGSFEESATPISILNNIFPE